MIFAPLSVRATIDDWGYIPGFLNENDPRSASEQFEEKYQGGWNPFLGFTKDDKECLHYPGDHIQVPLSIILFRAERLLLYPAQWVVIIQPDNTWEVARMD